MKRAAFRYLLRAVATELLKTHTSVEVEGGNGPTVHYTTESVVKEALDFDEALIIADGCSWVRFIFFNDACDCISDYTVDLEEMMTPILAAAGRIENGDFDIVIGGFQW